jgi:type I restriction-modification system DNA methylase subunit
LINGCLQLSALKQELEEAKQAMLESEKKLKFKEETATAAMAARDAAEKSLRLADLRASRLRDRLEELTHQLEEFENREDSRSQNRPRYVCWPWQWLGLDYVGVRGAEIEQQSSNEMELSEPLL